MVLKESQKGNHPFWESPKKDTGTCRSRGSSLQAHSDESAAVDVLPAGGWMQGSVPTVPAKHIPLFQPACSSKSKTLREVCLSSWVTFRVLHP